MIWDEKLTMWLSNNHVTYNSILHEEYSHGDRSNHVQQHPTEEGHQEVLLAENTVKNDTMHYYWGFLFLVVKLKYTELQEKYYLQSSKNFLC